MGKPASSPWAPPGTNEKPYLLQLIKDTNHAFARHSVDKRVLQDRILDCGFHSYIKQETCMNLVPLFKEKAEFTEHNDPGSTAIEVRADVYIFSPTEIKCIARAVDVAIGFRDEEIKKLQGILDSPMCAPIPPALDALESAVRMGRAQGEKSMQKRLDEALSACVRHADRVRELEASLDDAMMAARDAKTLMWKARYSKKSSQNLQEAPCSSSTWKRTAS